MPLIFNQLERMGHKSLEVKPSIVHQTPATQSTPRVKRMKTFLLLGILEYFMGVITVVVAIESLSRDIRGGQYPSVHFRYILTLTVQGIPCGVLMTFAGIVGMSATKRPSACMRSANRVLRTITAIFTTVAVVSSVVVAILLFGHIELHILHLVLPSLLLGEAILSVVHCVIPGAGICGRNNVPWTESKQIGGISNLRCVDQSGEELTEKYKAAMQASNDHVDFVKIRRIDTGSVPVALSSPTIPACDDPPVYSTLPMEHR